MRVVLALHDAGGTVPPMIAIAQELVTRGHEVAVLSQRCVERRARAVGGEFIALTNPDYATDRPIEDQIDAVVPMMVGRGPGDELLAAVEATGADVVVVDANLAGAAAAAEAASCPSTVLLHSMYETYVDTWFGELWPFLAPGINETRAGFGLADASSWTDVFRAHDRLYAAVPAAFDAPTSIAAPETMVHTGFLVPTATAPDISFEADGAAPLVLVSLSTTDMGQGPLLQTILDALDGLDLRGIVTTGRQRVDPSLRVPANVDVHDYLPHAAVLPHAAAIVTHAGLGTVAAALAHGVPMVCTPIARDQPLNAARVTELGAGLTVPAATATADDVRAALLGVLTPDHRAAARRVADASARAGADLAEHYDVAAELWSATSYKRLREEALGIERHRRFHPDDTVGDAPVTQKLATTAGPIVAVTDFMKAIPDQISRFVPRDDAGVPRSFTSLGTDGFGRSETVDALRRFFETDTGHVVVAVLAALAEAGEVEPKVVIDALERYGIDPDAADPFHR